MKYSNTIKVRLSYRYTVLSLLFFIIALGIFSIVRPLSSILAFLIAAFFFAVPIFLSAYISVAQELWVFKELARGSRTSGDGWTDLTEGMMVPDEVDEVREVMNNLKTGKEEAIMSQRRFLADASHEMRSPITIMKGNIEIALRRDRDLEEYRRILESNLEEIDRLEYLLKDLMFLARTDANELLMNMGEVKLDEVLKDKHQVLLGVTGSGKTFTVANVIANVNKPTLIISHNKTLAAQLYSEFKMFFPENAVEYFVSYYDYYQPEAYLPTTDTYIEKDSSINDEIDRMRHSATYALFERSDVIIVASVSCIYGLGSPEAYHGMLLYIQEGDTIERDEILAKLVEIQYERNDIDFHRGTFRARGDVIEIFPSYSEERAIRISMFGDEVESIQEIDPLKGEVTGQAGEGRGLPEEPLRRAEEPHGPRDARHIHRA